MEHDLDLPVSDPREHRARRLDREVLVEDLADGLVVHGRVFERREEAVPAEPAISPPGLERAERRRDLGELELQRVRVLEAEFDDPRDVFGLGLPEHALDIGARDPARDVEFDPIGVDLQPHRRARLLAQQRREHPPEGLVGGVAETGVHDDAPGLVLHDHPLVGRHRAPRLDLLFERVERLARGVLVGGIPVGEVGRHCRPGLARRERLADPAADLADLARDGFRDRDLAAGPGGDFARRVLDRADLHLALLVVDLRDPPHLPPLDERLAGPREVDHEPLVEAPDRPSGSDVRDGVGLLVGDHREVGVEVLPRAARLFQPVQILVEPENSVA